MVNLNPNPHMNSLNIIDKKVANLTQTKTTTEPTKPTETQPINAILKNKEITVTSPENITELSTRGYGTKQDNKLTLAYYEALYLQSKNIIQIQQTKPKKTLAFQQLLDLYRTSDPNAWAKYLTYRDLRSRGYITREGFGQNISFRMYERGEYGTNTAKYLILTIQEGQPITLETLAQTLKTAHSQKKELILAVLNRRGEVVHYTLSQLTLKKKQLPEE
jgi:tRNA-intron endonuclease